MKHSEGDLDKLGARLLKQYKCEAGWFCTLQLGGERAVMS